MESNIIELRYVKTGFLIQILLDKWKVEVISRLLFTSFAHKLQEDSESTSSYLFHNHDVRSLENIHPITFRKYTKHPNHLSIVKKINMYFFHKAFLKLFVKLFLVKICPFLPSL